jgi:hypothetical protein
VIIGIVSMIGHRLREVELSDGYQIKWIECCRLEDLGGKMKGVMGLIFGFGILGTFDVQRGNTV